MLTVALDLPRDLLGALDIPRSQLETRLRELIALELFREGRISSGKGAELLGVSKLEFVRLLAQNQVAYFTEAPEELKAEIAEAQGLLDGSDS
jgi:predicted HTH domain antitoxin